jgi:uncharacterized protein (TIGR03435 family)
MHTTLDSLTATLSLRKLIRNAYDLREFQVSGGPGWVDDAMWDIRAKTDAPEVDPAKLDQARRAAFDGRRKQRLQSLLLDRFHLTCHFVVKQLPVYEMVLAKGGPKFAETTAPPERQHSVNSNGDSRKIDMNVRGVTMAEAATALSSEVERLIVDKTGLTGRFDFSLTFAPAAARTEETDSPIVPAIFTSLEEQLGLKLVPSKGPVQVLVIDSVEKPSEN